MITCEECGEEFNQIADWQKVCPGCYYAEHPEKDFRNKSKQRIFQNRNKFYAQKFNSDDLDNCSFPTA